MERKFKKIKDNNEYYDCKLNRWGGIYKTVTAIVDRQPYSDEHNVVTIFNAIVDFADEELIPVLDAFDSLKFEVEYFKDENEKLKQEKAVVEKIFGIEELNAKIEELTKTIENLKKQ